MAYEAFCITYRHSRWTVTHRGRDLGSFLVRSKALQVAVEAAHWATGTSEQANIYIHDRNGLFYTAWCGGRDSVCLAA
jgi:hypothetical protein